MDGGVKLRVCSHPRTAARSCTGPPWSSLWRPGREDRTPARCHHRCRCTQGGRSGMPQKRTHTHTHICMSNIHRDKYSLCLCPEPRAQTSANTRPSRNVAVPAHLCLPNVYAKATCQDKSTTSTINEHVRPAHLQAAANIYLAAYPGSMQSWMSATQEFFCSESMVSRMYSAPFSTCGSSRALRSHRALHKGPCEGDRGGPKRLLCLFLKPNR